MNWKFTLFAVLVMVSVSAYAVVSECSDGSEAASDHSGFCGDNVRYVFDSSTGTLTISGSGDISSYSYGSAPWYPYRSDVKKVVIEDGVTSIGDWVFDGCASLASVTIPDSVTSIGGRAFSGCSSLASVVIGDGVTSIGDWALSGCTSLTSVVIGDGVTSIGSNAFRDCTSLTSVTIPDSVTSIGGYAFSGCSSLASVTIPDSVTSIGDYAFRDCTGLREFTIPISVNAVGSNDYPAFYGCTNIEKVTFTPGTGKGYNYGIHSSSSYSNYYGYTPWYYSRAVLKEVVIEDGVTSIGGYAFSGCSSLASVVIGNGVTSIGQSAFSVCTGLRELTIPDSVTSIGDRAFYECSSLASVIIPDGVTSIGGYAFCGCTSLASVTIPDSVTSIGDYAFYGCTSLASVTIPDSVTSIGQSAFSGCTSLVSMVVSEGNTVYCSVDGVLFSKDMKTLMQYPAGRSDDSYIIPDSVTSIGGRAFSGCSSLASVIIPDGVTSIGDYAFRGCASLASVTIPDSVTSIRDCSFYGCTSLASVTIPDSVTSIGVAAFEGCTSLASVTIPDSVTSIGGRAFSGCSSLTSIILPDSVTSIGGGAFSGCSSLTSIILPDSVTSIGSDAFRDCTSLASVVIGNGVTSIGGYAFSGCTSLASVTIPISVNAVGFNSSPAFSGCTNIEKVTFTPGTGKGYDYGTDSSSYYDNYYGYTPWYYSSVALEVVIEDGVTSIGDRAFDGCSSLTSIILPDSVTSINQYAFYGCTNVFSIRIGPDVSSIGYMAFEGNVFYDRDAVSVLSADADSLKGGYFVKTDDRIVKVDGHMMSFYVDGKVVYRGVFVEGDDDTPIPDVPFRPGYICSWEEFELGTEDVSVNAVYVLRELTVSFDPNGGSGSMDPVTTDVEHLFLRPENGFSAPDHMHMHFAGWAYSSDGEPIDFDGLHMADDAVLYALWAWDQYDVVYKVDGETVFTDTFDYGTEVTVRDMFQKTGYTVTDWSTDDAEVSDGKFVLGASDVVFDAASTVNQYDVVYKVDGETVFTDTFDYGTEVTVRDMFQKTGYTVTGWSTDDAEVSDGKFVLGASDVTFSAVSAANKYSYTVEYVDGDGNTLADPLSGTADYGSTVDAEIKDIVGYTAPSEAGKVFISEDESKNVVTYVYTIIVYTITFDDGTVQTDVKYTVKDSSVDEPPITKKKG
uniref:leucine-rich repeat protein n=1 Tax=Methanomethylophilus alvi TaxID=1291540 RepID=UPI0037DD67F5